MAYDRTDWHSGGDYPDDLPPENGGTHIGMFLAWIIKSDLEGEFHKGSTKALNQVKNEKMTGREFFSNQCDEKFWEDDLNAEGNAFAKYYYESGEFFNDYESLLLGDRPTIYHIEDSWENYHKLAPTLTKRLEDWRELHPFTEEVNEVPSHPNEQSIGKPWWKFW